MIVLTKETGTEGDSECVPREPARRQAPRKDQGAPPFDDSRVVEDRCQQLFSGMLLWLKGQVSGEACARFDAVEPELVKRILELGRLLVLLFLTCAEERVRVQVPVRLVEGGRLYERSPRKARHIGTFFGKVWFWRTHMYCPPGRDRRGRGFFPLDAAIGLTRDGFSWLVMSLAIRLAVQMPFERAAGTMKRFVGWSPATRTIEELVLGLGALAPEFQESAPAPKDDGDVLVTEIDSKGAPTATETELKKRRQERKPNPHPESQRHRGRAKRKKAGPKRRRAPGDKSKNAKMATMVVMYTLRSTTGTNGERMLIGPLNKRYYASFGPKKYAYEVARREAIKRGFGPDSGKLIQFVGDGDDDLEVYRKEYFADYDPSLIVTTIDLPHVMEYIWSAGGALFAEGKGELSAWAHKQKKRLLDSRTDLILADLRAALNAIPKTGPGNKGRRERLSKALGYIESNAYRMNYRELIDQDLELASGVVEGAVKHAIGYRFDHGGMRWIRERAEALLQLRCLALNGQWEDFFAWLRQRVDRPGDARVRLRRRDAAPLPKVSPLVLRKVA